MQNIEKSGFRSGEYVGYGFGKVFRITKHGGYWNAVSREKPQMNFTAKTLREISAYLDGSLKQNPAPKRKTSARTQKAAVEYVNRPSQITKKAPTKRLKKRRTINLQSPRGVFPNPAKRQTHYETTVQSSMDKKHWTIFARFPDTPEGAANAIEYAKAYAVKEPHSYIRVEKTRFYSDGEKAK